MNDTPLWGQVRGHGQVTDRLQVAVKTGRVAHAYLFVGPRGVGKFMTALTFAAALNCPQACGVCASCRAVFNFTHPDVVYVSPEGVQAILLEQIIGLIRAVNLRTERGGYKTVIIDDADALNEEAANALLKTLEEPPDGVVFVLVAAAAGRMPATILSRCRRVVFAPLPAETVVEVLVEKLGIEKEKAELAAGLADGRIGEASQLLANGWLDRRSQFLGLLAGEKAGSTLAPSLATTMIAAVKERLKTVKSEQSAQLAALEDLTGKGGRSGLRKRVEARQKRELARLEQDSYRRLLRLLGSIYRDALIISANADKRFVVNNDLIEEIAANRLSLGRTEAALKQVEAAGVYLERNVSPLLVLEHLFFALEAVA